MTGDDVRSAKFRERLRGYDPASVDAALDLLASRLDAGELHASDLADLHFPVRLRGYDQSDVDDLLRQLRDGVHRTGDHEQTREDADHE